MNSDMPEAILLKARNITRISVSIIAWNTEDASYPDVIYTLFHSTSVLYRKCPPLGQLSETR